MTQIILVSSQIDTTDEGIAAYKFGLKVKSIRWQDVRKIKRARFSVMGAYYRHRFYVYDDDVGFHGQLLPNLLSPIVFLDDIKDIWEFLDQINYHAWQYDFPLVSEDEHAATEQVRRNEFRYPAHGKPKAREVRVNRF